MEHPMSALQIRNLPDDLYQALSYRAECANRSLAQQTVVDLREAVRRPSNSQRSEVLARIQQEIQQSGAKSLPFTPEDALRADRDR
jgi:antitoxin FitA